MFSFSIRLKNCLKIWRKPRRKWLKFLYWCQHPMCPLHPHLRPYQAKQAYL